MLTVGFHVVIGQPLLGNEAALFDRFFFNFRISINFSIHQNYPLISINSYKKHDANMYSTVLFNVCNESYVIPQFEYRKNRIMFWFINVLFSTDVLFYLTSFEQQLLRYKQNEQKQSVHSLEPLFVQ